MKVAVLATDGVEQVELDRPWQVLEEAGAEPELVSLDGGEITAWNHLDKGDTRKLDAVVSTADPDAYAALVLPGGVVNGDLIRADADAVAFVTSFFEAGKPVAAICHAAWVLAEAGVVKGRRMTSWPSLQTDLRNAGADWVDEEVVVDGNLVTSRNPDDLDAFGAAIVERFAAPDEEVPVGGRRGELTRQEPRRAAPRPGRSSGGSRRRRGSRAAGGPRAPGPAGAATSRRRRPGR